MIKNSQNGIEKEQSCNTHISWFKNLLQSYRNQGQCATGVKRHINPRSKNKCPEINPNVHGQLIFDKGFKDHLMGKSRVSTNDARTSGQPHGKEHNCTIISCDI